MLTLLFQDCFFLFLVKEHLSGGEWMGDFCVCLENLQLLVVGGGRNLGREEKDYVYVLHDCLFCCNFIWTV